MTHTITLPEWQLAHFRQNDECLLLLPVVPQPMDGPGLYYANNGVWRIPGVGLTSRDVPYQPGDVLKIHDPTAIRGDFPFVRKQVVSETAKMAGDLLKPVPATEWPPGVMYEWSNVLDTLRSTGVDFAPVSHHSNPYKFIEHFAKQWNADRPETPWDADKLWLWAVELRNEPTQD